MESERQRFMHWNGVVAGEFVVMTFARTREGLSMPQGTTLCQGFVLPRKAGCGIGAAVSTSQSVAVPQPFGRVQHVATNGALLLNCSRLSPIRVLCDGALTAQGGCDQKNELSENGLLNCTQTATGLLGSVQGGTAVVKETAVMMIPRATVKYDIDFNEWNCCLAHRTCRDLVFYTI